MEQEVAQLRGCICSKPKAGVVSIDLRGGVGSATLLSHGFDTGFLHGFVTLPLNFG